MSAPAASITKYVETISEREAARIIARLADDTLYRSHGRYRWQSDGAVESGPRVLRLRRLGLLHVVMGVVSVGPLGHRKRALGASIPSSGS